VIDLSSAFLGVAKDGELTDIQSQLTLRTGDGFFRYSRAVERFDGQPISWRAIESGPVPGDAAGRDIRFRSDFIRNRAQGLMVAQHSHR